MEACGFKSKDVEPIKQAIMNGWNQDPTKRQAATVFLELLSSRVAEPVAVDIPAVDLQPGSPPAPNLAPSGGARERGRVHGADEPVVKAQIPSSSSGSCVAKHCPLNAKPNLAQPVLRDDSEGDREKRDETQSALLPVPIKEWDRHQVALFITSIGEVHGQDKFNQIAIKMHAGKVRGMLWMCISTSSCCCASCYSCSLFTLLYTPMFAPQSINLTSKWVAP